MIDRICSTNEKDRWYDTSPVQKYFDWLNPRLIRTIDHEWYGLKENFQAGERERERDREGLKWIVTHLRIVLRSISLIFHSNGTR